MRSFEPVESALDLLVVGNFGGLACRMDVAFDYVTSPEVPLTQDLPFKVRAVDSLGNDFERIRIRCHMEL